MRQCYKSENGIQPQPNYYFSNSRSCNEKVGERFCIYPNRNTKPTTAHFKLDNTLAYNSQVANFVCITQTPRNCEELCSEKAKLLSQHAGHVLHHANERCNPLLSLSQHKTLWNQYSPSLKLFESVCAKSNLKQSKMN